MFISVICSMLGPHIIIMSDLNTAKIYKLFMMNKLQTTHKQELVAYKIVISDFHANIFTQ